jgi:hypothetical protein
MDPSKRQPAASQRDGDSKSSQVKNPGMTTSTVGEDSSTQTEPVAELKESKRSTAGSLSSSSLSSSASQVPLKLQSGIGSTAPTSQRSWTDFGTDAKSRKDVMNMCIKLTMAERFQQHAAQLGRACLIHAGFSAVALDEGSAVLAAESKEEHDQVWLMMNNLTEFSALKAACMDREFWDNVEARQVELAPRLAYYTSPEFLKVLNGQCASDRSKLEDDMHEAVVKGAEAAHDKMTVQERERAYNMVVAANHKWCKWKPYDMTSKELADIVNMHGAEMNLTSASEDPVDLARLIRDVLQVHSSAASRVGATVDQGTAADASAGAGAGAGAGAHKTTKKRKQAKPQRRSEASPETGKMADATT